MINLIIRLFAVLMLCFGLVNCGGGKGGGGRGNHSIDNGRPSDTSDPPELWRIAVLKPYYGDSGQTRHREVTQDFDYVYHGILHQLNIEERVFKDDSHSSQILNVVHDIQDHEINDRTKRYQGEPVQKFGGFYQFDHVANDLLETYKFVYASTEPALGIVQLQNGELFTVGYDYVIDSLPKGQITYRGINVIGQYGSNNALEKGQFELIANFDENTAKLHLDVGDNDDIVRGMVTIDLMTGRFKGEDLVLNYQNISGTATINGSFHGENGTGVSGVYSDNDDHDNPRFYGAVVGTRTP